MDFVQENQIRKSSSGTLGKSGKIRKHYSCHFGEYEGLYWKLPVVFVTQDVVTIQKYHGNLIEPCSGNVFLSRVGQGACQLYTKI